MAYLQILGFLLVVALVFAWMALSWIDLKPVGRKERVVRWLAEACLVALLILASALILNSGGFRLLEVHGGTGPTEDAEDGEASTQELVTIKIESGAFPTLIPSSPWFWAVVLISISILCFVLAKDPDGILKRLGFATAFLGFVTAAVGVCTAGVELYTAGMGYLDQGINVYRAVWNPRGGDETVRIAIVDGGSRPPTLPLFYDDAGDWSSDGWRRGIQPSAQQCEEVRRWLEALAGCSGGLQGLPVRIRVVGYASSASFKKEGVPLPPQLDREMNARIANARADAMISRCLLPVTEIPGRVGRAFVVEQQEWGAFEAMALSRPFDDRNDQGPQAMLNRTVEIQVVDAARCAPGIRLSWP